MSQPGQVSHGIPPRATTQELARRIADLDRDLKQTQAALAQAIQAHSTTLNGAWVQSDTTPTITAIAASAQKGAPQSVTFPVAYSGTPEVFCIGLANSIISTMVATVSTTGFQFVASWTDGSAAHSAAVLPFMWIAVGPK